MVSGLEKGDWVGRASAPGCTGSNQSYDLMDVMDGLDVWVGMGACNVEDGRPKEMVWEGRFMASRWVLFAFNLGGWGESGIGTDLNMLTCWRSNSKQ